MSKTFYMGVIGTDGNRCVFWGVGYGDTKEVATEGAWSDSDEWLEGETQELQECAIDEATYERVRGGDPDADDFVESTRHGWKVRV